MTGTIDPGLYNLTELTTLDMGGNQLTGTLSEDIGKLGKLNVLYFHFHQSCRSDRSLVDFVAPWTRTASEADFRQPWVH
ncbi:hypothetical protein RI367_002670 [Sorochytrium milnesiophthora]